jgi:hypothetical protein
MIILQIILILLTYLKYIDFGIFMYIPGIYAISYFALMSYWIYYYCPEFVAEVYSCNSCKFMTEEEILMNKR